MFKFVNLSALTATFIFFAIGADTVLGNDRPHDIYGGSIVFDIYRNGEKIGYHRVAFVETKNGTKVDTLVEMEVRFLVFTAFKYRYLSSAEWDEEGLASLAVTVNDDGEHFYLNAFRFNGKLKISTAEESYAVSAPVFPTNHWNARVLSQPRVLNTLTGRINDVRITTQEREVVKTERGSVEATCYAYTGDLEAEVWYDDAGRWVKMRFQGRDGSNLEYICRRCQGDAMRKSQQ